MRYYYRYGDHAASTHYPFGLEDFLTFTFNEDGSSRVVNTWNQQSIVLEGTFRVRKIDISDIDADYRRFMPYVHMRPSESWYSVNIYETLPPLPFRWLSYELFISFIDENDIIIYTPAIRETYAARLR